MLNKKVLVKNVTNLSEARYCAGMFIEYISFDLNPESEYFIEQKSFEEIKGWVSGVKVLGSLENGNQEEISQKINDLQLDGFIFSQNQFPLIPIIDTDIKILEWPEKDLSMLPFDLDPEIILLVVSDDDLTQKIPEKLTNPVLQGYSFKNVKYNSENIAGYAFLGSFEQQVGLNSSELLMEAFEYIEENY